MPNRHRFSDSRLWQKQRKAFIERGPEVWRYERPIPDFGTTNMVVAYKYAQVILAFLSDWAEQHPDGTDRIYLVDLGAGTGRFAFNFMKVFHKLYLGAKQPLPAYTYVITDLAEENVRFCYEHPKMQPYIERGLVDVAVFDAQSSETLTLWHSGSGLQPGSLHTPLVLVANYFFDALPQDLFYFEDSQMYSVFFGRMPTKREHLELTGDEMVFDTPEYEVETTDYYGDSRLNDLLEAYRDKRRATHVLIPFVGVGCLTRLQQLSKVGFFMLSADVGTITESDLDDEPLPDIISYNYAYFSPVNYHALTYPFTQEGAALLKTGHQHELLTAIGLLYLPDPGACINTRTAFVDHFEAHGPDDVYEMGKLLVESFDTMSLRQLLAYIRLFRFEPRIFMAVSPRMAELCKTQGDIFMQQVLDMLSLVDNLDYPIGLKDESLSFCIAIVLFELGLVDEAKQRLEQAQAEGMVSADVYYYLALCESRNERPSWAKSLLKQAFDLDPEHDGAGKLSDYLKKRFST